MVRAAAPASLIALMCAAQILGLAGFATFSALLPTFFVEWRISNTEAGWINGIYFAGYVAAVPVLVSLTDRVDARPIWLFGMAFNGLAGIGFALAADGFWTAMLFRALAGIGLGGTFMPGLRMLLDRLGGHAQDRAVAFYSASFGVGSALSILLAGEVAAALDWRWAFAASALGPAAAILLVLAALPVKAAGARPPLPTHLLDFRPVLRCRPAMAYILAYAAHDWELLALRAWTVAFLAFAQGQHPEGGAGWWSPTVLATLIGLVGQPGIVIGGELARRFGRRPVLYAIMGTSAAVAAVIGFAAALPFALLVALLFIYGVTVIADTSSITAGSVANAPEGYRGATMAMHACVGFSGAFLGPLAFGIVLDLAGGSHLVSSWGLAFASAGLVVLLGPLALAVLARGEGRSPS